MGIEDAEFFDGRTDEVHYESDEYAIVFMGHDIFGDYQAKAMYEQDEWELDFAGITEGRLAVHFKRLPDFA